MNGPPSTTATRPKPQKPRVSFSGSNPVISVDSDAAVGMSPSTSTSSPPGATKERRSSLKTTPKPIVPKQFYQHADPLLRRLRLQDPYGKGVDLRREFRDTEVVGFLFGSSWSQGKVEAFYKNIITFTRRHPHRFKCIYCSVDTDEVAYKQNTMGRPWLAMEWADGSNLPVASYEDAAEPVVGSLANGEDFLLAEEEDTEADFVADDVSGDGYTRPFARVHLARYFDVWSVPTLVVYHVPTRRILGSRVKPDMLRADKADRTWETWISGASADLTLSESLYSVRRTIFFTLFALFYAFWVVTGGRNVLQELLLAAMGPAIKSKEAASL